VSYYKPGYGRVAAVEICDPCSLIFCRFGWLHSRLLLSLQDELQKLERELEREEEKEFNYGQPIKLKARRKDCKNPDATRLIILASIHEKLKEYGMVAITGLLVDTLTSCRTSCYSGCETFRL